MKEASHVSQSNYALTVIHVKFKHTRRAHTHTHTHTHKQTKLQKHIRILPLCTRHDPMFITESIIDDYNKTDARFMYKQNTQHFILHLKPSARVTKNYKIQYSNKGF